MSKVCKAGFAVCSLFFSWSAGAQDPVENNSAPVCSVVVYVDADLVGSYGGYTK